MAARPDLEVEAKNTRDFMYHPIHTLNELKRIDAGLSADYPLAFVFDRKRGNDAINVSSALAGGELFLRRTSVLCRAAEAASREGFDIPGRGPIGLEGDHGHVE